MSSAPRRPTRLPIFDLGTVVTLSTMIGLVTDRPLVTLGSTGRRNRGASVESPVKPQMVMDSVPSKRSSWIITAGRGCAA